MSLLVVLDLVGTFVFAISGASGWVTRRLDLFWHPVLTLPVAGNLGGGVLPVPMMIPPP